jgi:long-chain acyl-CoA synthetase
VTIGLENFMRLEELAARALATECSKAALGIKGRWRDWGWMRAYASEVGAALDRCGICAASAVAFVPRNRPAAAAALLALIEQGRTIFML